MVDDPLERGRFTRWVTGPAGERWAESSLQLAGLRCAACTGIIEQALMRVPGVKAAEVSAAAERATVSWDPELTRPSALMAAVRAAGYDAVPDAAAPARELRRRVQRQALWRLFVAGFCAMQVMMFATPSYVAGAGELSGEMRQLLNWGSWIVTLPVMLFAATPFLSGAWHTLRSRRIGMDVPVALGILITFVASTGATFEPGGVFGSEVYFDSLTMFITFLLGARWLELHARQHAAETLERALARLPETAWRVGDDGEVTAVSVLRLHVGDRVRVPLGQAFPADGRVEQGQTLADESLLSGESAPLGKAEGDTVVAGSINVGAAVLVRVLQVGGDTRLEAIVSMMRSALTQRPAAARLADRWAAPFLWAVLVLAAGAAAWWSVTEPSRALWVAVSVLIVTCPCALSLAAPATLVAAARGLARRGVLLQRLDAIEVLATAGHFFFDKTGTLTEDRLQWRQTVLTAAGERRWPEAAQARARAQAAALAEWSAHPLARALADCAHAALPWHAVHEQAGQGLRARDEAGCEWRLGSAAWVGAGSAALGAWAAEGVEAKRAKTEYRWGAPTSPGLAPWAREVIPGGAGFSRVAADDLLPPTLLDRCGAAAPRRCAELALERLGDRVAQLRDRGPLAGSQRRQAGTHALSEDRAAAQRGLLAVAGADRPFRLELHGAPQRRIEALDLDRDAPDLHRRLRGRCAGQRCRQPQRHGGAQLLGQRRDPAVVLEQGQRVVGQTHDPLRVFQLRRHLHWQQLPQRRGRDRRGCRGARARRRQQ